jgi:hypothetical protein
MLKQVPQYRAAGRLIGRGTDEARPLVGSPHRTLGQLPPNEIRLLVVGAGERLPDLLCGARDYAEQGRHAIAAPKRVQGFTRHNLDPFSLNQPKGST